MLAMLVMLVRLPMLASSQLNNSLSLSLSPLVVVAVALILVAISIWQLYVEALLVAGVIWLGILIFL